MYWNEPSTLQGPGQRRQRNTAGRRPPESAQGNKTVFPRVTYDITYDIISDIICDIIYQYYDIIVCVMISLVICDIMLGHMIS